MRGRETERMFAQFRPQKDFFIGIDSDGCVFDTMELKQRKCFAPAFIETFGLDHISDIHGTSDSGDITGQAHEVWDFVNLHSKNRGCNRFIALEIACRYLTEIYPESDELAARLDFPDLRSWMAEETKLGNPSLELAAARTCSRELERVLRWSELVNVYVKRIVTDVPPFSAVAATLKKLSDSADIMVVSQTPCEAIAREWKQHGLDGYIREIAGQEHGTKTIHLEAAAAGRYLPGSILMIGDAPGDHDSATANGMLFYPIIPGREEQSWERLLHEAGDRFLNGTYAGAYESELVREFYDALPDDPPWKA